MINAQQLLADLTRLLKRVEDDLRRRIAEIADLKADLQVEWQAARDANRTAEHFESWADQVITQAGVHWLLSCVFLRFIEDNQLVHRPWISGTPESGRLALARDRHEAYFRAHPLESDRDYLLACFREAGTLPGLHTFFNETHNPIFRLGISGDAAMAVLKFWQQVDPNTGALGHDFTDPSWNTRFLGDLYQDLSEATRKRYALLQTPEFVEEFILDRTLTPAIREFSFREVRMIDPTCGSGHFLLGGFRRLVDEWSRGEPMRNRRDVAQRALDAVAGVDLNPFAVAIARFRLLVAALKASDVQRLTEAPDFKIHVAIGDSLLHGKRFGLTATDDMFQDAQHFAGTGLAHAYASEDLGEVQRILGRQYHAVVGNPPYILVKDVALNAAYRKQYVSCHGKYSLACPFIERFFQLALTGRDRKSGGFAGLITTDSFMKREFGSALIEDVLPRLDLTHVVSTGGANIPGHGTPTVIIFGRHQLPVTDTVRLVMGITGKLAGRSDPAQGDVWTAILRQIDVVGSESEFISVADVERLALGRHPWSIGGGGAAELKEMLEADWPKLGLVVSSIGITSFTLDDDVFVKPLESHLRAGVSINCLRPMVDGDNVRDWLLHDGNFAFFPYDSNYQPIDLRKLDLEYRYMWRFRTGLENSTMFGQKTKVEAGLKWWEFGRLTAHKLRSPLAISFAFYTTHNHFTLDKGGRVFNRTAPVIKLDATSNEEAHFSILALLNSSVACFWLKQVCQNRGSTIDNRGARQRTAAFEDFYEFTAGGLKEFPVATDGPTTIATHLDELAHALAATAPDSMLSSSASGAASLVTRAGLDAARQKADVLRQQMISMQEELDWKCYRAYGILPALNESLQLEWDSPPKIRFGERAFEIVLARQMSAGTAQSTWFQRHGSTPITKIPSHWPDEYRRVVQRRIDLIECDRNIALIERPEYKRRWNTAPWEHLEQVALRNWLLARLGSPTYWPTAAEQRAQLSSTSRLADSVQHDTEFVQVATLYAGHADFDPGQLVAELVASEAVPFLPVLRYSDTGLRKRAQWEDTWALQRREDAGESVGKIPVPPKYQSKDFLTSDFWRLRGGLDVPKERWVSYPGCERGADGSLVIAWADWNHLQRATALAGYYVDMKDTEGWEHARLQPLLAGLLELVFWLEQWHNELDPAYGERMGTYYKGFVTEEARASGLTLDDLRAWKPQPPPARRGRKKAA